MAKSMTAYKWNSLGPVPQKPLESFSPAQLLAMVRSYEETLRRLIADADDNARLFKYQCSPKSDMRPDGIEAGRNQVHQQVRRMAAYTLKEFHS